MVDHGSSSRHGHDAADAADCPADVDRLASTGEDLRVEGSATGIPVRILNQYYRLLATYRYF